MIRLPSAALAALCFFLAATPVSAHDIPSDVRVQIFLRPEGQRMRVMVRVPLASIIETVWPEQRPGVLDLAKAEPLLQEGAINRLADDLELYENDRRLDAPRLAAARASLPSDRSFDSYGQALAYLLGPPLPDDTELVIAQGLLDVLFEYAIQSDRSDFSVRPNFVRLGLTVQTIVHFQPPERPERRFSLHDDPGVVELDPSWFEVARLFVADGARHIFTGGDHLLFLCVLVIPFRRLRALAAIVTSFTVAHSVALIASSYGMTPSALWFPPLVDTLIAGSVLFVALDNLIAPDLRRRWKVAFGFGLAHGFGFAAALQESLQFAGTHFLVSLLSFNMGLEIGQLAALLVIVPAIALMFRYLVEARAGSFILTLLIAHTAWHWTVDRYSAFRRYQFFWPALDAAFFVVVIRWLMVGVALAGLAWLIFGVLGVGKGVVASEQAKIAEKS
jgi:hypothetical protein